MEFWSVEVKAGKPLNVQPVEGSSIHLSNASLGESKDNGTNPVPLFVKIGDEKLVLGTLSSKNIPQIAFDLFFEKEFELSHNWKHGTVYFCGYRGESGDDDHVMCGSDCGHEHELEEELNLPHNNTTTGKPKASKDDATKLKLKLLGPNEEDTSSDDDDYSELEEDSDDVQAVSEESDDINDSEETDDEESSDEDEETPKKVESGKKRPAESATETSVPAKKVKLATPQKTDGKKSSVHFDTPRPTKQAVKTHANSGKSKARSPKSHSKAKH